jgi:group I intron endonuclease
MDNIKNLKNGITGIYLLRNLINGKIYVGKSVNIKRRMYQHSKPETYHKGGANTPIVRAIKKYGFENFSIEILQIFEGEEKDKEIIESEIFWIKKLKSNNFETGYNLLLGGTDWTGYSHSDTTKQILSEKAAERYQGENNPMFGKKHTKESKEKISNNRKQNKVAVGENNPFFGKVHSDETKRIISEKAKLRGNPKRKRPILQICLETGSVLREWDSAADAGRELGFNKNNINNACHGIYKTSNGFAWKFKND